MLEGGPLDGEAQVVEMVPTARGSQMLFNLTNYQTFDPEAETETVLSQGLQAIYGLVGEGPDPTVDDRWDTSWIFIFTGESYVPTPAPVPPPGPSVPVDLAQVLMSADTTLVPDTLPIIITPTVIMGAQSSLDVEPVVTPVKSGDVVMTGETVMSVTPDWTPRVQMSGETTLQVVGTSGPPSPSVRMSGQSTMQVTATSGPPPPPPPPVPGYLMWFDAAQIKQADNTPVPVWADLSGNGYSMTLHTSSTPPQFYSTTSGKLVNGLPAVWFGASTAMVISSITPTVPVRTVFIVLQDTNGGGSFFLDGTADANRTWLSDHTNKWVLGSGVTWNNYGTSDALLHVFGGVWNGASSTLDVDTVVYGPLNLGADVMNSLTIGANDGNAYWLHGPICEVVVYPTALNVTDRTTVRQYLGHKWGVAV